MNTMLETGIIAALVTLAAAFAALRIVKTVRSGRPSCCCSGGGKVPVKGGACPRCTGNAVTSGGKAD